MSPDGRWLAYTSDEGGSEAIWLRSFPEPGPALRVSSGEGDDLVWDPDGEAIYYIAPDERMMRRDIRLGDTVELGEERDLFSIRGMALARQRRDYDIHPDGDRFMFITWSDLTAEDQDEVPGIARFVVVANWFEELRERMGDN